MYALASGTSLGGAVLVLFTCLGCAVHVSWLKIIFDRPAGRFLVPFPTNKEITLAMKSLQKYHLYIPPLYAL